MSSKPIWHDRDIDPAWLTGRRVAVLGYGNQGRPQALNLRDSGIDVRIGARAERVPHHPAHADGLDVRPIAEAVHGADVVMCLLPDEVIDQTYATQVLPSMRGGQYLGFAHGLAIHAGWIRPEAGINVFLMAPKSQGRGVRAKYLEGSGVPGLVAVHQDPAGDTVQVALGYAQAIGCGRIGVLPTTFEEETVTNLFAEQAVLCGGLSSLVRTAFDVLVEDGYSPEISYLLCLYEVKLLGDLLREHGIAGMRDAISPTARYGDVTRGPRVIDAHVKETMHQVLSDVTSGRFAEEMRAEFAAGGPLMRETLEHDRHHPIERVHAELQETLFSQ
jgi:ketol-acid reductoisomerase